VDVGEVTLKSHRNVVGQLIENL